MSYAPQLIVPAFSLVKHKMLRKTDPALRAVTKIATARVTTHGNISVQKVQCNPQSTMWRF